MIRYFIVVDLIVLIAPLNKVSDRNKVFVSSFYYYYIKEFKRLTVLKITNETINKTIFQVQMEKLPFLKLLQCLQGQHLQCGWTTAAVSPPSSANGLSQDNQQARST